MMISRKMMMHVVMLWAASWLVSHCIFVQLRHLWFVCIAFPSQVKVVITASPWVAFVWLNSWGPPPPLGPRPTLHMQQTVHIEIQGCFICVLLKSHSCHEAVGSVHCVMPFALDDLLISVYPLPADIPLSPMLSWVALEHFRGPIRGPCSLGMWLERDAILSWAWPLKNKNKKNQNNPTHLCWKFVCWCYTRIKWWNAMRGRQLHCSLWGRSVCILCCAVQGKEREVNLLSFYLGQGQMVPMGVEWRSCIMHYSCNCALVVVVFYSFFLFWGGRFWNEIIQHLQA